MQNRGKTKRLAVLAGAVGFLSLAGARAEAAAQITFQLRPTSPTVFLNPGDVVSFDVYAVIQNLNGNNADDGFSRVHTSIVSTEAAGAAGLIGNLSPLTL